MQPKEQAFLLQLSEGLGSHRAHLVLVGGWAHRLYRYHPLVLETLPNYPPLATQDADIAVPLDLPPSGSLHEQMLGAGFIAKFVGATYPPTTKYLMSAAAAELYVEFLAPLHGSDVDRHGDSQVAVEIAHVTVQRLRGIDLLLIDPWLASIPLQPDIRLQLRVAHPASYITQKLLHLQNRRHPADSEKDLLYVHDTLELFQGHIAELNAWRKGSIDPELTRRQHATIRQLRVALQSESSALVVGAIDLAKGLGREISVPRFQADLHEGLQQLLG